MTDDQTGWDDPMTRATDLTAALKENTASLDRVQHNYRNVWVFLILVVIALAVSGDAVYGNTQARHDQCARDNIMRQANLDLWRPLLLEPVPPLPADATDSQRAARVRQLQQAASFKKTLETGFATHAC